MPATVTVCVVPRERFGLSLESLDSVLANMPGAHRLVYVDGGSPPEIAAQLAERSERHGFRLIRTERLLSPNEARNMALAQADPCDHVAFVDNDVLVEAGWLDALVRCAEDTGAWVVGPLYLMRENGRTLVHMAGGEARVEDGVFFEEHRFAHKRLEEVEGRLARGVTEVVEFHCMLVRRNVFETLGPLDEELLSVNEHTDLCLSVRTAGGEVWFEPAARIVHVLPGRARGADLRYHLLRWSDAWNERSFARFSAKWGARPDAGTFPGQRRWLRRHRRSVLPPPRAFWDRVRRA